MQATYNTKKIHSVPRNQVAGFYCNDTILKAFLFNNKKIYDPTYIL